MSETLLQSDDIQFRDSLIESYGTKEALAEELMSRIDEVRDLRKELEGEKAKRAPAELRRRIRELEQDLATVNARLIAAQNPPPL